MAVSPSRSLGSFESFAWRMNVRRMPSAPPNSPASNTTLSRGDAWPAWDASVVVQSSWANTNAAKSTSRESSTSRSSVDRPGLNVVVQGSTSATSSSPRVIAWSSLACLPDEPMKIRGLFMRDSPFGHGTRASVSTRESRRKSRPRPSKSRAPPPRTSTRRTPLLRNDDVPVERRREPRELLLTGHPRTLPLSVDGLRRPAKAGGFGARRQRAGRQAVRRVVLVVRAWRHVVGRVGVEQRGEQLDLPAADAQLPHPAAVHRSPLPRAARVHLEQRTQAADARRLDIHHARRKRRRADVLGTVDRRVVGDALDMIAEPPRDLGQVVWILQVRVRERCEHAVVQRAQRLRILHLQAVLDFEVDRVDRAGGRDLVD